MFSLLAKKNGVAGNYVHITSRTDWERVLDNLFVIAIQGWRCGLAVISNTTKNDSSDERGYLINGLTFRMNRNIPDKLKQSLRIRREQFEQIFELTEGKAPDFSDCYRVKNLGFPRNTLLFPIYGANGQKALLVFGGTFLKRELVMRLGKVDKVLLVGDKSNTVGADPNHRGFSFHKSSSPSTKKEEQPKAPPPISAKQVVQTPPEVVKARLLYLEDLPNRSVQQQCELERLDAYVNYLLRKSF